MFWKRFNDKCSIGLMIGVILAAMHLCLVILAYTEYINSKSSTSALVFILFFTLDAPIHLLPSTAFQLFGTPTPLILYGIFGSGMWFLIPWLIDKSVKGLFPKTNKLVRSIIIIALIPLILFGFSILCRVNITRQIQAKRPDELKKVLNQASSDFLENIVVCESDVSTGIVSVYRKNLLENPGDEIIMALLNKILLLDDKYQEISRLALNQGFTTIEPLYLDEKGSYGFLAYRYDKGVWLLDSEANELWSQTEIGDQTSLHPDGVQSGDMNGDGIPEFAVYYRYRDGIRLLDVYGDILWKYPINALGHLEIVDFDKDNNDEIIYTNSNNASGRTTFTILNATGTVANQIDIPTTSYEFEVIKWPEENSDLCILLTEENIIRIIGLDGQTVMSFDAPGCRTYGTVQAAKVAFNSDTPSFLVVKKNLHPDLMALYVYNRNGTLVYQKTDVMEMGRSLDFAVVPIGKSGDEGLVIGSISNMKPLLIEYSLTH